MSEPIAKCRCGRLFPPMEWAELPIAEKDPTTRHCPCGLIAVKIQVVTLSDIERAYQESLEEDENDID